jgi:alpha-tubulin suppressor-like RCC1 family protein
LSINLQIRTTPQIITASGGIAKQIVTHHNANGYLLNNGNLYTFGQGASHALCLVGVTSFRSTPQLSQTNVSIVAMGGARNLNFVKNDGVYFCGTEDSIGQFGTNSASLVTNDSLIQIVPPLSNVKNIQTSRESAHSFTVLNDDTVYVHGRNADGQLGLGHTTAQKSPIYYGFFPNTTFYSGVYSSAFIQHAKLYFFGRNTVFSYLLI